MSSAQVELANPHLYESPREYVEKHLAPIVAELHRITNELVAPGATSDEEWSVDMVPSAQSSRAFSPLDRRLADSPKSVVFNGAEYESLPKELLRSKQLKVQLSATVYALGDHNAEFRLVDEFGVAIQGSSFFHRGKLPTTITCHLPFGNVANCVAPISRKYIMQGRGCGPDTIPVCRRFSMSFVYL